MSSSLLVTKKETVSASTIKSVSRGRSGDELFLVSHDEKGDLRLVISYAGSVRELKFSREELGVHPIVTLGHMDILDLARKASDSERFLMVDYEQSINNLVRCIEKQYAGGEISDQAISAVLDTILQVEFDEMGFELALYCLRYEHIWIDSSLFICHKVSDDEEMFWQNSWPRVLKSLRKNYI